MPKLGADALAERFRILADRWEDETRFLSNSEQVIAHPAHRAIVALGDPVVPLILDRMRAQGGHWFYALHAITGTNPVAREDRGVVAAMQAAWLQWGRDQGYG